MQLKSDDPNSLYLFRSGNFYIFVGEDCDTINEYVVLKKTKFSKESYKCGFPVNVLDDYLHVFKNHNLNIKIINLNTSTLDKKIIDKVINLDLNSITPVEALNILKELKERLTNEV